MWRAPNRPDHKISQSFNDGVVVISSVTDDAEPGDMPVPELTEKITLNYEERKLGISRYYNAMQNQIKVQRVIRVPDSGTEITSQDVAETEDGKKYRIDLIQSVRDVFPPCLDITLAEYSQGVQTV